MVYVALLSFCISFRCRGMASPCHGTMPHAWLRDLNKKKYPSVAESSREVEGNGGEKNRTVLEDFLVGAWTKGSMGDCLLGKRSIATQDRDEEPMGLGSDYFGDRRAEVKWTGKRFDWIEQWERRERHFGFDGI